MHLLEYMALLKGVEDEQQVQVLLGQVGLAGSAGSRFDQLSGGQVRLVGACQAFLGKPRLVILDELTHGLDLQERLAVFRLVRRVRNSRGLVIFSTHVPQDVEQVADQVVVLHGGQVLFAGDVEAMHREAAANSTEEAYLKLLEAAR